MIWHPRSATRAALALLLAVLAGCAASPSPAPPPASITAAPAEGPPEPFPAVTRAELASSVVPGSEAEARRLLVGRWHGHLYEEESSGTAGADARVEEILDLRADGTYTRRAARCRPSGRYGHYSVDRDADETLVLELAPGHTCSGRPACADECSATHPKDLRRLDGGLLVLVDGMTGAVWGYRRVTPTDADDGASAPGEQ